MNDKIQQFLASQNPETPCLVVDVDRVVDHYASLRQNLPGAEIFYAMKANPAPEIIRALMDEGASFDVASIYEIRQLMALEKGVHERISFGNTIKKEGDIAEAFAHGIRLFAFDSIEELQKLSRAAPGSKVYCRLLMTNAGAQWPTSRKFGCDVEMARDLLIKAQKLGLDPYGVSFHVGSQQTDVRQWDIALGEVHQLFVELEQAGVRLSMLNLGGGMPIRYREDVVDEVESCAAIRHALEHHFGDHNLRIWVEPGRSIVGDAGVIETEVVLISKKSADDERRWVYLDIGKFGGLPETMGECIRYSIETDHDDGFKGPVVIAGPTCDEVDILYDQAGYLLPLDLKIGDRVRILATGAYTATYSSVGFNGFPPLKAYYI
ncbi:MAG: type III PLP-dependent enzyme [Rhodospirillales bacterium]|jgi:ornithine decarboxylase|nr:type III PLP-dependent enzyme [Rhodospirillales bacterium]MBT4006192.1 type III PLP-dependent enzyme [Rhodospirillales bacterium]MBT5114373.1 type III PLP-dependent enzyme [Rhodospirillales bacterium]MBT5672765.1 type III PLP-dependent enzyme [Rhodospirillales bacterium]MBT6186990.1 type III PLP-dependent enzyme [Rhodospirillales bacterium]